MERRSATVRAGKAREGIFTARAVSYGVMDDYRTVFLPGSATEGLNRKLPVICWGHDLSQPVGRATSWRDTAHGPEVTARLDTSPDVPRGRQAVAQIDSGTLTAVSIGFESDRSGRRPPTDDEMKRWPGVDEVFEKITILEVSLTALGAVPGAEVLSMRSRNGQMARDLAAGRITAAQYRQWQRLDDEIDAALRTVTASQSRRGFDDTTVSASEARRMIEGYAKRTGRNEPHTTERREIAEPPERRPSFSDLFGRR